MNSSEYSYSTNADFKALCERLYDSLAELKPREAELDKSFLIETSQLKNRLSLFAVSGSENDVKAIVQETQRYLDRWDAYLLQENLTRLSSNAFNLVTGDKSVAPDPFDSYVPATDSRHEARKKQSSAMPGWVLWLIGVIVIKAIYFSFIKDDTSTTFIDPAQNQFFYGQNQDPDARLKEMLDKIERRRANANAKAVNSASKKSDAERKSDKRKLDLLRKQDL